jgi:signal recognition particle subunit SRP54
LKQHRQMQDAFKMMARGGGKGFARMAGMMGLGGPGGPPDLGALEALGRGQAPPPGEAPALLPGLGGSSLPGLGGQPFNPFRKP